MNDCGAMDLATLGETAFTHYRCGRLHEARQTLARAGLAHELDDDAISTNQFPDILALSISRSATGMTGERKSYQLLDSWTARRGPLGEGRTDVLGGL